MVKKFKLFNTEWTVKSVDGVKNTLENSWEVGNTDGITRTISIADNADGVKLSKESKELTFYHELVHAIFQTGNYLTCNSDEPLVEWVANCLFALKKQKVL